MGLMSGSASYTRLRILDRLPDDWRDKAEEGITHNAFRENLDARSGESNVGWTIAGDPGHAPQSLNDWLYSTTAVLGVRADGKRVNGKLLKIKVRARIEAVMRERGVERLGAAHRREIREAVEEELLSRALPALKIFEVLWDVPTGSVLVFATDDAGIDAAKVLLADTIGFHAYAFRLVDWLTDWTWEDIETGCAVLTGSQQRSLPLPEPERFLEDPLRQHANAVASEFLLWLWFKSEHDFGTFTLPDGPIDLWFDDKLVCLEVGERKVLTSFSGGAPSTTPEAKMSIIGRKAISEARLGMRRGEAEWSFVIKVTDEGFGLRSVKVPAVVKDGTEEIVYERAFLLDTLHKVISGVFGQFVRERTGSKWGDVKVAMDAWLMGDES